MNVSKFSAFPCAALLVLLATAPVARAQSYDFTFTDGGVTLAQGSFDTNSSGLLTDGSFTLTAAAASYGFLLPAAPGTFNLVSPPGMRANDGTDIIIDNVYSSSSDPTLTGDGLGFGNVFNSGTGHYNYLVNLYGNAPGNYGLFEAGQLPDGSNHVYTAVNGGLLNVTPVPEPSTYAAILGAACLGFAAIRRKRTLV